MVTSPWLYVSVVAIGAIIGSFLNVCIYRLPKGQSIIRPGSTCPACSRPIPWFDNIPLVSFLLLGGRCRQCQFPISLRYPLVELINGLGYLAILWQFGWTGASVVYAGFFSALVVITWIDFDHQIIPDVISLPGILLGLLAAATLLPIGFLSSVAGVVLGGGVLWALAAVSPYLFGKEGLGGGDIKFLAMIGAFLGWQQAFLTLMIASVVGALVGVSLILFKVMKRKQYIPFGPFLALGAVLTLFFHSNILGWYFRAIW